MGEYNESEPIRRKIKEQGRGQKGVANRGLSPPIPKKKKRNRRGYIETEERGREEMGTGEVGGGTKEEAFP